MVAFSKKKKTISNITAHLKCIYHHLLHLNKKEKSKQLQPKTLIQLTSSSSSLLARTQQEGPQAYLSSLAALRKIYTTTSFEFFATSHATYS